MPREQVVVATKVFNAMGSSPNEKGLSSKHIRHSIDASLKRLQLDYVDLYQIHRFDRETPIEETLEALDAVVRAGKALAIGASSMFAWQFQKLLYTADRLGLRRFVTMQNHYNLVYREEEREMIPLCLAEGVGIIPWSPLAGGFLSGKYKREGKQPEGRFSDGTHVRSAALLGSARAFEAVEALEGVGSASYDIDTALVMICINKNSVFTSDALANSAAIGSGALAVMTFH